MRGKKMKKKLLAIAIMLVIFGMVITPVAALPIKSPLPPSNPWNIVWGLFQNLQNQITALLAKDTDLQNQINNIPGPVHFGEWVQYEWMNEYTASTDGFVVANCYVESSASDYVAVVAVTPDETTSIDIHMNHGDYQSFTMPVKAGDKWMAYRHGSSADIQFTQCIIYWLPLST
jgi:hypothetical protein